jgi:WD40 repeat protein
MGNSQTSHKFSYQSTPALVSFAEHSDGEQLILLNEKLAKLFKTPIPMQNNFATCVRFCIALNDHTVVMAIYAKDEYDSSDVLVLFDTNTRKLTTLPISFPERRFAIEKLLYMTQTTLFVSSGSCIYIVDLEKNEIILQANRGPITQLVINSNCFLSISGTSTIELWSVSYGGIVERFKIQGFSDDYHLYTSPNMILLNEHEFAIQNTHQCAIYNMKTRTSKMLLSLEQEDIQLKMIQVGRFLAVKLQKELYLFDQENDYAQQILNINGHVIPNPYSDMLVWATTSDIRVMPLHTMEESVTQRYDTDFLASFVMLRGDRLFTPRRVYNLASMQHHSCDFFKKVVELTNTVTRGYVYKRIVIPRKNYLDVIISTKI